MARFSGRRLDVAFVPSVVREQFPVPVETPLQVGDDIVFCLPTYAAEFGGKFAPSVDHFTLTFARVLKVTVGKTVTVTLRTVDGVELRKRQPTLERLCCLRMAREGERVVSWSDRAHAALRFGSAA